MPRKIEPYIADGIVDIPSSIINPEIMRNIRDVYDYIYKNREVNLENNDKAKKLLFILQREQKETYYPPKEYEENVNKILDKKFSKYEKNLNSEKINKVVEIILRNFIENKILQRVGEKVKVYIAHPLDDYLGKIDYIAVIEKEGKIFSIGIDLSLGTSPEAFSKKLGNLLKSVGARQLLVKILTGQQVFVNTRQRKTLPIYSMQVDKFLNKQPKWRIEEVNGFLKVRSEKDPRYRVNRFILFLEPYFVLSLLRQVITENFLPDEWKNVDLVNSLWDKAIEFYKNQLNRGEIILEKGYGNLNKGDFPIIYNYKNLRSVLEI